MIRGVAGIFVVLASLPAFSHHSNSAYQVDEIITLTGTVTEWRWSNPHTWLFMVVEDENGEQQEWAVEGRAPGILSRTGWNPAILQAGEMVLVHASPAKDGSPEGIIARVTKADGSILGNRPDYSSRAQTLVAASASAGSAPNFRGLLSISSGRPERGRGTAGRAVGTAAAPYPNGSDQ